MVPYNNNATYKISGSHLLLGIIYIYSASVCWMVRTCNLYLISLNWYKVLELY